MEGLCTVVLWGQPSQLNGQIIGFNLQFYIPGVWYGAEKFLDTNTIFHRVQDSDINGYQRSEIHFGVSELYNVISMHTFQAHLH